jgi:hypothetical protein
VTFYRQFEIRFSCATRRSESSTPMPERIRRATRFRQNTADELKPPARNLGDGNLREHEGKTKVKGGIICAIKTNEGFAFLET